MQEMWEWSNNGISYSLYYKLSYAGFLSLKLQSVLLNYTIAPRITEIKELKQFRSDIAKPRENTEYTFEYAVGPEIQFANFTLHELKCRSEKFYPANTIHPKLAGNGINLNCEFYTNNVVSSKWKYVFLVWIMIIFVTMAYGPIAAFLVEMFPTKIRYTSMSLPYHIGNGVFGGLVPFIATLLSTTFTKDPLVGLWYPIGVAALCFIIGALYLSNKIDKDVND